MQAFIPSFVCQKHRSKPTQYYHLYYLCWKTNTSRKAAFKKMLLPSFALIKKMNY